MLRRTPVKGPHPPDAVAPTHGVADESLSMALTRVDSIGNVAMVT